MWMESLWLPFWQYTDRAEGKWCKKLCSNMIIIKVKDGGDGSLESLLCKHEDLSSHKKMLGVVCYSCNPSIRGRERDKKIPGTHWPSSLVNHWAPGSIRDCLKTWTERWFPYKLLHTQVHAPTCKHISHMNMYLPHIHIWKIIQMRWWWQRQWEIQFWVYFEDSYCWQKSELETRGQE